MSESFPLSSILADDFPLFLFERNIKHQKWTSLSPICSQSINKILLFLNLFHILFFFFYNGWSQAAFNTSMSATDPIFSSPSQGFQHIRWASCYYSLEIFAVKYILGVIIFPKQYVYLYYLFISLRTFRLPSCLDCWK